MYELPELAPRKKKRKPYRKPDAIKHLERMAFEDAQRKHPSVAAHHLAPRRYRDDSANSLTKAIIDYLRLTGSQAERINSTGRYVDNTMIVEDVTGRKRSIGTSQWLPSSGQKGTSDISAVINGRAVKIEVKYGKDRQSEDQKRYQEAIEKAGGIYILVKTFEEFKSWHDDYVRP